MKYLRVPDSDIRLVEGNVIILQKYPTIKWILNNGWYEYQGDMVDGWYITSETDETVLPITEEELEGVVIVSTKYNDALPPYPYLDEPQYPPVNPLPPCPPEPPPPPPVPPEPPTPEPIPPERLPAFFSQALKTQLEQAFISVATVEERDAIKNVPDGKIVRVNDVLGKPKYYEWFEEGNCWRNFDLITADILDELLQAYLSHVEVAAGSGLAGGGTLDNSITLSHDNTGTGSSQTYTGATLLELISSVSVDEFGHVSTAEIADITEAVADTAQLVIDNDPDIARINDIPTWHVVTT